MLISVVANLRFQMAVVQPECDEDAASIALLSIIIAVLVSLISFVTIYLLNHNIRQWLNNDSIGVWLYFIPISVLIFGIYQPINFWQTREKNYKKIAMSKVGQGAAGGLTQLCLGPLVAGPLGLVVGYIIGQMAGLLVLIRGIKGGRSSLQSVTPSSMRRNARRYKRMPMYSAPGALLDNLSVQMPNFFIARFFDLATTGFFGLIFRVLNLPVSLISAALGQLLLQRLAENANRGDAIDGVRLFVLKIFLSLVAIISPFVLLIKLYGNELFAITFGEEWRGAGDMAETLVLAVAVRFAVAPLSAVMALDHNVKKGAAWQAIYLITITCTLTYFSSRPLQEFLTAFVIHELVLYAIYLAMIINSAAMSTDKI